VRSQDDPLVPPVLHSLTLLWPTLSSSCRDIAFSQSHDPHAQILRPFIARSRDMIPRSDPMVLLWYGSNDCPSLATSQPRELEYPMFGLSTCELPSSRDLMISRHLSPQMDGYDLFATSPLRDLTPHDFEYPILGLLLCELPSSRDLSISATCPLRWTATNPSLLRCSRS
jgi:hypothetical protein